MYGIHLDTFKTEPVDQIDGSKKYNVIVYMRGVLEYTEFYQEIESSTDPIRSVSSLGREGEEWLFGGEASSTPH